MKEKRSSDTVPGGFTMFSKRAVPSCYVPMPIVGNCYSFVSVAFALLQHSCRVQEEERRGSVDPLRKVHTSLGTWSAEAHRGSFRQVPLIRSPSMPAQPSLLARQPARILARCLPTCCSVSLPVCSQRMATVELCVFSERC